MLPLGDVDGSRSGTPMTKAPAEPVNRPGPFGMLPLSGIGIGLNSVHAERPASRQRITSSRHQNFTRVPTVPTRMSLTEGKSPWKLYQRRPP